jgi:enamine deaminase RidA (YjgF/YER057c/UK114 family)
VEGVHGGIVPDAGAGLQPALGLKVLGFVKCAEGFNATPAAVNGFSDLVLALWGDAGRHARSAIGAGELPFGMPVEVEAIVSIDP